MPMLSPPPGSKDTAPFDVAVAAGRSAEISARNVGLPAPPVAGPAKTILTFCAANAAPPKSPASLMAVTPPSASCVVPMAPPATLALVTPPAASCV
ncbi:MAG: hypothetical protein ACK56F_23150, partial [bacterium]